MKQKLIMTLLTLTITSCQYHAGEMYITGNEYIYQGDKHSNMCEYEIHDKHSGGNIKIIDTYGKFQTGQTVYIYTK